eukprot:TRINITY_DN64229_c0_g1_i1.p1 TRINITY_DN64229_c0_g1~~TRINITY_DN64229_c0_g1_i1.p1  ORF type:complete len:493 (+),score=79.73 TRINITY_DN64229_c0_g1_i1:58-1536(+)
MPRNNRRARPKGLDGNPDQLDRTIVFQKTKMCKFHILGACARGTNCFFAHDQAELNPLPDLSRTKLCKTLISTGFCEDGNCKYAHNKEELRGSLGDDVSSDLPVDSPSLQSTEGALGNSLTLSLGSNTVEQAAHAPQVSSCSKLPVDDGHQLVVKNTFIDVSDVAIVAPGRLRPISSAAGRLDALAVENTPPAAADGRCGDVSFALEASYTSSARAPVPLQVNTTDGIRLPEGEKKVVTSSACASGSEQHVEADTLSHASWNKPVQIDVRSLRSISSSSLVALASGGDEDDASAFGSISNASGKGSAVLDALQPQKAGDLNWARTVAMRPCSRSSVESLFSERALEPARIMPGRLRSIRSAGGRLDALGEEDEPATLDGGAAELQHRVLLPQRCGTLRYSGMEEGSVWVQQTGEDEFPQKIHGSPKSIPMAGGSFSSFACAPESSTQARSIPTVSRVSFKDEVFKPLRVVRTAGGRLDLMASVGSFDGLEYD